MHDSRYQPNGDENGPEDNHERSTRMSRRAILSAMILLTAGLTAALLVKINPEFEGPITIIVQILPSVVAALRRTED